MKTMDEINKHYEKEADRRGYFAISEPLHISALAISKSIGLSGHDGIGGALQDLEQLLASNGTEHQELLLLLQSELLHAVCVDFAMKIKGTSSPEVMKLFADIAFKAQNQSRRTITALADLKSPKRTTFIKQQNNAVNQQVNNTDEAGVARQHESAKKVFEPKNLENIPANELMEELNYVQRMDAGAQAEAVRSDTAVEAVGAVNRAEKRRGES